MSDKKELINVLEVITKQYAFRSHTKTNERCISAGGMPHLEAAFNVLTWDDPLIVKEGGCDYPGCEEWATLFLMNHAVPIPLAKVCSAHHGYRPASNTSPKTT